MRRKRPDSTRATGLALCLLAVAALAACANSASSLSDLPQPRSDPARQIAGDSGPSLRFARAARDAGDLQTAIRLYRTLAAEKSAASAVKLEFGDVLLAANMPDDAIDMFSQVTSGGSEHLGALLGLTKAHLALGESAKALDYADQALAAAPRGERVLVDRGVALDLLGGTPRRRTPTAPCWPRRRDTCRRATTWRCRWR
jgi:tetratricopeptide (TPR) repeat protein